VQAKYATIIGTLPEPEPEVRATAGNANESGGAEDSTTPAPSQTVTM
jgi:hypothetical protein